MIIQYSLYYSVFRKTGLIFPIHPLISRRTAGISPYFHMWSLYIPKSPAWSPVLSDKTSCSGPALPCRPASQESASYSGKRASGKSGRCCNLRLCRPGMPPQSPSSIAENIPVLSLPVMQWKITAPPGPTQSPCSFSPNPYRFRLW